MVNLFSKAVRDTYTHMVEYNECYYGGKVKLPRQYGVHVLTGLGIARTKRDCSYMEFMGPLILSKTVRRETALHELIHLYLIQIGEDDGHGPNFQRELDRLMSLGAFKEFHLPRQGE